MGDSKKILARFRFLTIKNQLFLKISFNIVIFFGFLFACSLLIFFFFFLFCF